MTVDLTKTGFKYTVNANGTVSYTALCDGKVQNLSNRNTSSEDALKLDLAEYTIGYIAGLSRQLAQVGDDIIVGVQSTADAATIIEEATPLEPSTPEPAPEA